MSALLQLKQWILCHLQAKLIPPYTREQLHYTLRNTLSATECYTLNNDIDYRYRPIHLTIEMTLEKISGALYSTW